MGFIVQPPNHPEIDNLCLKNLNRQPMGFQGPVQNDHHDILPIIFGILPVHMNKLSCFEHMG